MEGGVRLEFNFMSGPELSLTIHDRVEGVGEKGKGGKREPDH